MALFLEFHLIQNFAPSNLNRDDVGAPKDALFGGHRRARISSQCLKRAIRLQAAGCGALTGAHLGVRTKKLKQLLEAELAGLGHPDSAAQIEAILAGVGLKLDGDLTEYLLFLGKGEVSALAALIHAHWDELSQTPAQDGKKSKKEAKASLPDTITRKAKALLNGQKAVDVALFGRMLADLPEVNQEAACQVAHALSTHRVEREFDYFTAVDDQGEAHETGAGMIGQVEFNSATFYRYAVIDVRKLMANLQEDLDLSLASLAVFTEAMARAIPSGKQNTFAAHNPPSFVGVSLRHQSPLNLVNAFEKPVWGASQEPLTVQSVARLADYDSKLAPVYGDPKDAWAVVDLTETWPVAKGTTQSNLKALSEWVIKTLRPLLEA